MPKKGTLDQQRERFERRYKRGNRRFSEVRSPDAMEDFERLLKQTQLCYLKAQGLSHRYCADALGVSTTTITEWLADEKLNLRKTIQDLQANMLDSAMTFVEQSLIEIADGLLEIFRTTEDEKLAKEIGFEFFDRFGFTKVNKSESVVRNRQQVDITDKTGIADIARKAPPNVQQALAQKASEIVALASEHAAQDEVEEVLDAPGS
jgi:hypothetical protein